MLKFHINFHRTFKKYNLILTLKYIEYNEIVRNGVKVIYGCSG